MKHHTLAITGLIGLSTAAWAASPATTGMSTMMQAMQTRMEQIVTAPDIATRQKLADQLLTEMPGQCGSTMGRAGQGMMGSGTGMMQPAAAQ
jgi:hypothetical protein